MDNFFTRLIRLLWHGDSEPKAIPTAPALPQPRSAPPTQATALEALFQAALEERDQLPPKTREALEHAVRVRNGTA